MPHIRRERTPMLRPFGQRASPSLRRARFASLGTAHQGKAWVHRRIRRRALRRDLRLQLDGIHQHQRRVPPFTPPDPREKHREAASARRDRRAADDANDGIRPNAEPDEQRLARRQRERGRFDYGTRDRHCGLPHLLSAGRETDAQQSDSQRPVLHGAGVTGVSPPDGGACNAGSFAVAVSVSAVADASRLSAAVFSVSKFG